MNLGVAAPDNMLEHMIQFRYNQMERVELQKGVFKGVVPGLYPMKWEAEKVPEKAKPKEKKIEYGFGSRKRS